MNFIDTDLWHKRAPGEITGSATATPVVVKGGGPLMNLKSMSYLPVFQKYMKDVLEKKGAGFMGAPLILFSFVIIFMSYRSLTFEGVGADSNATTKR